MRLVLEAPVHPVVRRRRMVAAALTLVLVALGVVLVVALGPETLAVYLPPMPLALVLLWVSTGALRFDEREESSPDVEKRAEAAGPSQPVEVA